MKTIWTILRNLSRRAESRQKQRKCVDWEAVSPDSHQWANKLEICRSPHRA